MNTKQRFPLFPADQKRFADREVFPDHVGRPSIVFADDRGKIRAGCFFGSFRKDHPTFDLGRVPDDIVRKGKEAVYTFAEERARNLISAEWKRTYDAGDRIDALQCVHEIVCDGTVIKGVVTRGQHGNGVKLTMTEPFQITAYLDAYQSADPRLEVIHFDDDGNLLLEAIEQHRQTFIRLFRRQTRRLKVHPLLEELHQFWFLNEEHDLDYDFIDE